jgi:hypothetical protein
MARYVEGQDRTQCVLFPERLDDWIQEDSTVRVIDVFVEELDLKKLGFDRTEPALTGRPAYSPATLLKIYIYGYLNRVQSSRRLEAAAVLPGRVAHLKDKITKVKQQIQALNEIGERMKASEDGQISLTDPDAKHHLIVAHEVTIVGHDRNQLAHMAKLAKAATAEDELIALADRGYYEGYEILECERAGVAAVVPKPMTSNNAAAGLFDNFDACPSDSD